MQQEIIACPPHSTSNKRAVLMRAFLSLSLNLSNSPSLTQCLHYSASPWSAQAHWFGFLLKEFPLKPQLLLLACRFGFFWSVSAPAEQRCTCLWKGSGWVGQSNFLCLSDWIRSLYAWWQLFHGILWRECPRSFHSIPAPSPRQWNLRASRGGIVDHGLLLWEGEVISCEPSQWEMIW